MYYEFLTDIYIASSQSMIVCNIYICPLTDNIIIYYYYY